jgi:hypothetical protein
MKQSKIDPPTGRDWTLHSAGVFKCGSTNSALCFLLWKDSRSMLYFEHVHGHVGGEVDPNKVVKISRSRCVGTYVSNKKSLAVNMWNSCFERYAGTSASPLLQFNWEKFSGPSNC